MTALYNTLSSYLKKKNGCKVFKVTIDGGFTCPNRDGTKGFGGCVYCEPSTLVPKEYAGADIRAQLEAGIEKVRRRHRAEKVVAYFQVNTNTYAPLETLARMYREAFAFPEVIGMAVSTRPDCVDDRVLNLLKSFMDEGRGLWLELGLQSANDRTLRAINRGHTTAEFEDAVVRAHRLGIDVCAHVIVGLPGEGREEILNTMRFLGRQKVWGVKFHQMQVIKGTALQGMYEKGVRAHGKGQGGLSPFDGNNADNDPLNLCPPQVRPLSLDEYAGLVVESLEVLPPDMVIHRLCGDVPSRYLVAPNWGANKFMIMERITALMKERKTFQGARFTPCGGQS
jgi:radical SAM protein (TIGR01212 family)